MRDQVYLPNFCDCSFKYELTREDWNKVGNTVIKDVEDSGIQVIDCYDDVTECNEALILRNKAKEKIDSLPDVPTDMTKSNEPPEIASQLKLAGQAASVVAAMASFSPSPGPPPQSGTSHGKEKTKLPDDGRGTGEGVIAPNDLHSLPREE
nr:hypothetical transcript [Hymenolepis microstoma]